MNPYPIILVDQDNVLADQRLGFYNVLEREYPHIARPPLDALDEFDIELSFPEEHRSLITSLRLMKGFFRSLPEIPGAREGLERLQKRYKHVWIVTAPTWTWAHCIPEKYAWIEERLGSEWCGRTILARDKTLVHGDVLIDDNPSIIGVRTPTWHHMIYAQPYNERGKDATRVTWESIDADIETWMRKHARTR